jgi:DNA adenine methylase
MNGGPIGGKNQRGKWKLDARFNKIELQKRISKIKEYRDRIHVSICDGMDLLDNLDKKSTFFFIDPPYYEKGKLIYLNSLDNNYHVMLSEKLRTLNDSAWVLTYDDCPEIRKLYSGWAKIKKFTLQYSASERRNGKEILIVPRWITLPKSQNSLSICW